MIVLIDNYDSFTYNLVHYLQILQQKVSVYYNNTITVSEIHRLKPTHIVLSPGPKGPEDAGICLELIESLHLYYPILGVCLGHQCIAQAFGARIIQANSIMHGKTSRIQHNGKGLFTALPTTFTVARYHSLTVDPTTLPPEFVIDAYTTDNTIMAIRHRRFPLFGLQFHPEAILSEQGLPLLERFSNASFKRTFRAADCKKTTI